MVGNPPVVPSYECVPTPLTAPPNWPWPTNPTQLWGGYPPLNPTAAWADFAPPPTGCVYGLDGITRSWVPVPTRWEVMCLVQQGTANAVPEALERLLRAYLADREAGENLRQFFARHSADELRNFLAGQAMEAVARDLPAGPVPQGIEG